MNNFSYTKANSVDEAVSLTYANEENKIIAGGTNIIDLMKYFVTEADTLIDINPIDGIAEITESDNGGIRIGALMTNADTAYHPIIEEKYPLLSKAILAELRHRSEYGDQWRKFITANPMLLFLRH